MSRHIELVPADEINGMGETVRKANTGVRRHGIKATVFSRILQERNNEAAIQTSRCQASGAGRKKEA